MCWRWDLVLRKGIAKGHSCRLWTLYCGGGKIIEIEYRVQY